jgi:hypothetical protein
MCVCARACVRVRVRLSVHERACVCVHERVRAGVPHAPYPVHPRALAVVRQQRIPQQHAQRQRVARAVEVDLSSGTQHPTSAHGLLKRYSRSTQGVLKGHARGTQGVLKGYSRDTPGDANISRAAHKGCALNLPFECGARPLLVRAVAADVYLRRRGAPFGGRGLGLELSVGLWAQGVRV